MLSSLIDPRGRLGVAVEFQRDLPELIVAPQSIRSDQSVYNVPNKMVGRDCPEPIH